MSHPRSYSSCLLAEACVDETDAIPTCMPVGHEAQKILEALDFDDPFDVPLMSDISALIYPTAFIIQPQPK